MTAGIFKWLGTPQIEVDGRPVKLETRKATALLALLSVEKRPYSRESLAAMFWPEYDAVRAPANLRRVLASLQKTLGEGWLSADRDVIEFTGGGNITVDCCDFAAGIGKLRSGASDIHPQPDHRSAGILTSCMDRYGGEFLEGFNLKDSPVATCQPAPAV